MNNDYSLGNESTFHADYELQALRLGAMCREFVNALVGTTLPVSSLRRDDGSTTDKPKNSRWKWIVGGVLTLLVIWIIFQRDGDSPSGIRKVFTADGIEYAFRWCPPGEFMMGATDGFNEKPVHKVKITRGFWMLETEVTQVMWESVMGSNPSRFTGAKNPVEQVSWYDCKEFCKKLSQKLGQQVQLPTEAQWEYACRASTTGDYAGNLDEMGWYWDNSGSRTHEVGLKKPNAWGLYDMHGNVWEWCSDWFGDYTQSPTSDPTGPTSGLLRVSRGGCWDSLARNCHSAVRYRFKLGNQYRYDYLGLRVTLVPVPGD